MGRKHAVAEEQRDEFTKDYKELGSIQKVAMKWGIHYETARGAAHRFGVIGKHGASKRDNYHPKLGIWSDGRVARELGVSRQAVATARSRRGIPSKVGQAMRAVLEEE